MNGSYQVSHPKFGFLFFNFYAMSTNDGDLIIASALNVKRASICILCIPMMEQ